MENGINIPLNLPGVSVVAQSMDTTGNIHITVESTQDGCECPHCKKTTYKSHGYGNEKILRHTSILGMNTYIHIRPRRYECTFCPGTSTMTERLSWYEERSQYTIAYEHHVLLQLVNSTVSDISIKERLTYDAVEGIINRHIGQEIDWETVDNLEVIGIDDLSRRKGRKDRVAVVSTRDVHGNIRVIGLLDNHKKETVKSFFLSIPNRLRKTVKYICSDLYEGFLNAAREVFGKRVSIVADRFHIAKLYGNGLDDLRKSEVRRLEKNLPEEEAREVKKAARLIHKVELTKEEREELEKVFKHSAELRAGWELRNRLTEIFNSPLEIEQARSAIHDWECQVKKSGMGCFDGFLGTLKKYKNYILNYFDGRKNSGFVEGLNNKIRVLSRRCYGIMDLGHWFQRLALDLEGSPFKVLVNLLYNMTNIELK